MLAPDGPHDTSIERAFDGARLWGIELEPKFRVLAATIELSRPGLVALQAASGQDAESNLAGIDHDDPRIQLLTFPVSQIIGSLRRVSGNQIEVLTFDADQLIDVTETFGGARLKPPMFGNTEPKPGQWAPTLSLEGRSTAPDGRSRTVTFSVVDGDLHLDLFARFDQMEVRGPSGELVLNG